MNSIKRALFTVVAITVGGCVGYFFASMAISVGSVLGSYNSPFAGAFLGATVGYVNVW